MPETIRLRLEKMAHGGKALGRHQGKMVFISHALPGESLSARITSQQERFAHAFPIEVLEAAPERVVPACPHFYPGGCGGCHFQHADYAAQLRFKQEILKDQLERLGGMKNPPLRPIIPARSAWAYRSQMVFTLTAEGLALPAEDGNGLVQVDDCPISAEGLMDALSQVEWEEESIRRIRVQQGSRNDDLMIIIETDDDLPPEIEVDIPVSINLLLSDNEPVNLIGWTYTTFSVFERSFRATAGVYLQPNLGMLEPLVEAVMAGLSLQGEETVLDLYAGVGMFTAFIAGGCGLVISVESYPPAVSDADENLADLENVELVEGAVEEVLGDMEGPLDRVLVDPPPAGLSKKAASGIAGLAPQRIVYVSHDPGTLARDLKFFASRGYLLDYVQPLDLLPQTAHITAIAVLNHRVR